MVSNLVLRIQILQSIVVSKIALLLIIMAMVVTIRSTVQRALIRIVTKEIAVFVKI